MKRFLYFHMETREMVLDACDLVTVVVPPALPTAMVTLPRCPFAGSTPRNEPLRPAPPVCLCARSPAVWAAHGTATARRP